MNDDLPPSRRRALAHTYQFWAGPLPTREPLPPRPPTMIYPDVLRGRPKLAHQIPFFVQRPIPVLSYLPGVGVDGAATFLLSLQPGTKIVYSWATTVITSHSGREQRESLFGVPKQRYEGNAFLLDGSSRDVRGAMMRAASLGATFIMALPFEELQLSADSAGTVVNVDSTASCDWMLAGQRVIVVSPSGATASAVIQSFGATTISLDVAPGVAGRSGGLVMPLIQILLDPQQGFARYPTRVDLWALRARASVFGFAGVDSMGVGAEVTTMTAGVPVPIAELEANDLMIWDRPNEVLGTANEVMLSGAAIVDLGAKPFGIGGQSVPIWGRSLKFHSSDRVDWQWWKAFVRRLRGRQGAFLLATNHEDLVYVATVASGIMVASASVSGAGDYVSWFASEAHRRLAITVDAVVRYVHVTSVTDNLDGTLTLALDFAVVGTVTKVSMLELVRFDRDELEASWNGGTFMVDEVVRAVQEAIEVPSRFWFETVLTPPTYVVDGVTHQEITLPLGSNTAINFTIVSEFGFSTNGRIGAITAAGGNVDGMIVLVQSTLGAAKSTSLFHEDTLFTASSRIRVPGLSGLSTGVFGAILLRYNGELQRWITIGLG